jgi:hypothetical protein
LWFGVNRHAYSDHLRELRVLQLLPVLRFASQLLLWAEDATCRRDGTAGVMGHPQQPASYAGGAPMMIQPQQPAPYAQQMQQR